MSATFRAAVVQLRTGIDPARNRAHISEHVRAAAAAGASLVATPEGSNLLQRDKSVFQTTAPLVDDTEEHAFWSDLAKELAITLLAGSCVFRRAGGKAANRSLLFGPDGAEIARYDKIHLFDVNLGIGQESRESATYDPGEAAVLAQTPAGKIGLTICYDLRFPHLYRQLAQAGAELLAIPAAFTRPTGEAHWEVLMRTRAIETGAYVLAPAQGGQHEDGRQTWGRSLIVDPWGRLIAHLDHDEPGFAIAEIDLAQVQEARAKIPAWSLNQPFAAP
jgi:deaminated glutathione amidase